MGLLRVMTYNIRHGRGMDGRIDLHRIAALIEESGADLVSLNEVDRCTRRCGGVDQAAEIARLLNMEAQYCSSISYQGGEYGNAVLSRRPIRAAKQHELPLLGQEKRSLLHTEITLAEGNLHFLVTHLGLGDEEQQAQLVAIAALLETLTGPVVLCGDFNFDAAHTNLLAGLPTKMVDVWPVQDTPGNTFPSDGPIKRIDYILGSQELTVQKVEIMNSLASDHLPLVATFGVHGTGRE